MPTVRQRVRDGYRRIVKAGGRIAADGQLIGLHQLLVAGCLDETGFEGLADNMETLALIAESLKNPNTFRPSNIPSDATPTLNIHCGTNGTHRFDWTWSNGVEEPET